MSRDTSNIRDGISDTFLTSNITARKRLERTIDSFILKSLLSETMTDCEIKDELSREVGIATDVVDESLKRLLSENRISKDYASSTFQLSAKTRQSLEKAEVAANHRLETVFSRFFRKAETEASKVHVWAKSALLHIMDSNFDKAIQLIHSKSPESMQSVSYTDVLDDLLLTNEIKEDDYSWLTDQLEKLVKDSQPDVHRILYDHAVAAFDMRLLRASVSPDELILVNFEKGIFLLDTNVLFALQEAGEQECGAIAKILHRRDINSHVLKITCDEYDRAIVVRKEALHVLLEHVNLDLITRVDPFLANLSLRRECKDINELIEATNEPLVVEQITNDQKMYAVYKADWLERETGKGLQDENLKNELRELSSTTTESGKKKYRKTENIARHDAGLISAGQALRKAGGNAWVVTTDHVVEKYCRLHCSRDEQPLAIHFSALMNLLVASDVPASDYSPEIGAIFASSLVDSLFIEESSHRDLSELKYMAEQQAQILQFPNDVILEFAAELTKMRLEQMDVDEINRALNVWLVDKKTNYEGTISSLNASLKQTERNLEQTKQDLEKEVSDKDRLDRSLQQSIKKVGQLADDVSAAKIRAKQAEADSEAERKRVQAVRKSLVEAREKEIVRISEAEYKAYARQLTIWLIIECSIVALVAVGIILVPLAFGSLLLTVSFTSVAAIIAVIIHFMKPGKSYKEARRERDEKNSNAHAVAESDVKRELSSDDFAP